jgi:membrane fusion protein (multidrug efflux system)
MNARTSTPRWTAPSLLALALALGAAGCHAQASSPAAAAAGDPAPLAVKTTTAEAQPWPRTLALTGTLAANRDSDVAADALGKVIATFVERGTFVKKGAPLVMLDRRGAALGQEQARAQAALAERQLAQADSECARADRLFAGGAIHQAEHDRARTACEAARLQAAAAGAGARLAQKTLGDAVVRAPFAGLVVERHVTEGEFVRPDMRVVTLVEVEPLRLELAVPEAAFAQIADAQEVAFRVAAFPEETFRGRVRHVGGALRRSSRDLVVEAVVANADRRLRPGMFATADLVVGEAARVVVPAEALRPGSETTSDRVFVVKDGRVEERLVVVEARAGDRVALRGGLSPGERVVTPVSDALRDGLPVK